MNSNCKEIGSEFSNLNSDSGLGYILPTGMKDIVLTFSGRTGIDLVLQNNKHVRTALLPSYCCDSMIDPFRQRNIKLVFYDVKYEDGLKIDIGISDKVDLIFWCHYFGYKGEIPELRTCLSDEGIIIEDITHSLFSKDPYSNQSDYLIASVRKWGPLLCGGFLISKTKPLQKEAFFDVDVKYSHEKTHAMELKEQYITEGNPFKKEKFLEKFHKCNEWLAKNYQNVSMDEISKKMLFSKGKIQIHDQRILNAKVLHEGLKNHPDIVMLFDEDQIDCPLFVPVIIKNNKRDYYRQKLIKNNIYCPVHWPHPNADCKSNLYDIELSLVCDQRYDIDDMKRIILILYEELTAYE